MKINLTNLTLIWNVKSFPLQNVCPIRELTESIPFCVKYPQVGISNPQLGMSESCKEDQGNKSPILNTIEYPKWGIWNTQLGVFYPNVYFLLLVLN